MRSFRTLLALTSSLLLPLASSTSTVSMHDYPSLANAAYNPPFCEVPYASLDLSRVTAKLYADHTTDCGSCLRVCGPAACTSLLVIDQSNDPGRALDISTAAAEVITGGDTSAGTWDVSIEEVGAEECVGVWTGEMYANVPDETMPPNLRTLREIQSGIETPSQTPEEGEPVALTYGVPVMESSTLSPDVPVGSPTFAPYVPLESPTSSTLAVPEPISPAPEQHGVQWSSEVAAPPSSRTSSVTSDVPASPSPEIPSDYNEHTSYAVYGSESPSSSTVDAYTGNYPAETPCADTSSLVYSSWSSHVSLQTSLPSTTVCTASTATSLATLPSVVIVPGTGSQPSISLSTGLVASGSSSVPVVVNATSSTPSFVPSARPTQTPQQVDDESAGSRLSGANGSTLAAIIALSWLVYGSSA
ncbi:hypothetical protein BDY21DRAFT_66174 [Lineolata rhizophorae]|uniref:RlpA-like double-psi beta-barrel-protein domain-containing protein-containing protein n=1 Tax=Lineolata rhizophorae TaxID=578093 RepID=A0A6A6NVI4_9PEZI|nr:hypothetical protein BDY21DRAFT_66174 [Lineolata rhizophorae]